MQRGISLLLTLLAVFSLTSCIDGLTSYSIEYPVNNGNYIGTVNERAPNDDGSNNLLDDTFIITYDSPPSGMLEIVLNGNDIGDEFVYEPSRATADIESIKQYFRQGKNTLSVNLLSFGPQIVFYLDSDGPNIILTKGETFNDGDDVRIEGFLRDPSAFSDSLEVDLIKITGFDDFGRTEKVFDRTEAIPVASDGSFSSTFSIEGLQVADRWEEQESNNWVLIPGTFLVYEFKSKDIHGYEKVISIASDAPEGDGGAGESNSLPIYDGVRVAVGDSFIESLKPLIAAGLKTTLDESPIRQTEADFAAINPLRVDIGLGNMPTYITGFTLANGEVLELDDGRGSITTNEGTFLLNKFKTKGNNVLDIGLIITALLVDLRIELPGWISWLIPNLQLEMYIDKVIVDTQANVSVNYDVATGQPNVSVVLDADNSNFGLQDINVTKTKAGSLTLTGLVGALIPLLEPLIGDLLPGIVNPVLADNLTRLAVNQRIWRNDLVPERYKSDYEGGDKQELPGFKEDINDPKYSDLANVPYTDIVLDIFDLGTGSVVGDSYDLLVGMQTKADTKNTDQYINQILGSYFNDDPIDRRQVTNGTGNLGTNITLGLKSNFINQLLSSVYSIGQMHLTLHDGTVHFGGNPMTPADKNDPTKTLAKKGDMRTKLWPDMPPIFEIYEVSDNDGAARASITYPSAVLSIEKFDGDNWNPDIALAVDFDLAILVNEKDGAVTLGAAGPPVFNVNEVINNTNIQVPEIAIQAVLDAALFFGGDALADQLIALDLNDIADATINGQYVQYFDANDNFNLTENQCAVFIEEGVWGLCDDANNATTKCNVPQDLPVLSRGSGGGFDLICQEINFEVQTDTVGVTGDKGTNLFFQMGARDPAIPPAPAIPRFDLDADGVLDYKDNCAVSQYDLALALEEEGIPLVSSYNSETGEREILGAYDPRNGELETDNGIQGRIFSAVNAMFAERYGANRLSTDVPQPEDIAWYNKMRKGDPDITNLGAYPWLTMLFSNASQLNTDGDRVGELCENDFDRDGVYEDNIPSSVADEDKKYWRDNCPFTPQLNPDGEPWNINGGPAYFWATETDETTAAGDACDVRMTFVMLRSLESKKQDGSTPRCLAKVPKGDNWISDIVNGDMPVCDPSDENQRFYIKAVNNTNLDAGIEFYTDALRDQNSSSRLGAYGYQEKDHDGCVWAQGSKTYVTDLRLLNRNDTFIKNENKEVVSGCGGRRSVDRADPIWYPVQAQTASNYDEFTHPWYIHTDFNFSFTNSEADNEIVGGTCIVWSPGFGSDVNAAECPRSDPKKTNELGAKGRWAIWVGGNEVPWNGVW